MNHLLAFVLCLTGFVALAFAMRRQQRICEDAFTSIAASIDRASVLGMKSRA